MLEFLQNLFNSKVLISIFDRIFDFDIFDYRNNDEQFSFFSPTGIIILFIVVLLTGNFTGLSPGQNCPITNVFQSNEECVQTWRAVGKLTSVLLVAYLVAGIIAKPCAILAPSSVTLEHLASLFVLGCMVMMIFHIRLEDNLSIFVHVSDFSKRVFGTGGTTNNAIASTVVAMVTVSIAVGVSWLKRVSDQKAFEWDHPAATVLVCYYLFFLAASLSMTFFQFDS